METDIPISPKIRSFLPDSPVNPVIAAEFLVAGDYLVFQKSANGFSKFFKLLLHPWGIMIRHFCAPAGVYGVAQSTGWSIFFNHRIE
ncbi:MAG: hypothetical protein ACI8R4_000724 [Paracoccaceae bacterium]